MSGALVGGALGETCADSLKRAQAARRGAYRAAGALMSRTARAVARPPIAAVRMTAPYAIAASLALLYGQILDRDEPMMRDASAETFSPGAALSSVATSGAALSGVAAATQTGVAGFSAAIGPVGVRKPYSAPAHSLEALRKVPFRAGRAIDEGYRAAFADCDERDHFMDRRLRKGACSREPNRFGAFLRLPSFEVGSDAVFMDSAMTVDLSGGWQACGQGGSRPIDARACSTFFDYPTVKSDAYDKLDENWDELFVSSDRVPYVTIPARAPIGGEDSLARGRAFSEKSGIEIGDVGVVIYRDRIVPVLVANAGPTNRALAGSLALFDAIGVDRCRTRLKSDPTLCAEAKGYGLGDNVVTILFPNSRVDGLSADTVLEKVRGRALERLSKLFDGADARVAAGLAGGPLKAPKPAPNPRMMAVSFSTVGAPSAAQPDAAAERAGDAVRARAPEVPQETRQETLPVGSALRSKDGRALAFAAPPKPRPVGSAIVITATSPPLPPRAAGAAPRPAPRPNR